MTETQPMISNETLHVDPATWTWIGFSIEPPDDTRSVRAWCWSQFISNAPPILMAVVNVRLAPDDATKIEVKIGDDEMTLDEFINWCWEVEEA